MSAMMEELESLLFDWDAGDLDEPGLVRLREILRTSEEARAFYIQHQVINAAMKLDADAGLEPPSLLDNSSLAESATTSPTLQPATKKRSTSHVFRISYWAAAVTALLFCVLAGRVLYLEFFSSNQANEITEKGGTENQGRRFEQPQEATSSGVAMLTRLVDVEWGGQQAPLEVGDALLPGRLSLAAGYAQVEFFCGATVVVEGPAELDLKSATLARIHRGRLRAHVPPAARGFSLEVDDMKVVDLGTELGLAVSPEEAHVQVFDGEVELHPAGQEKQLLSSGDAVIRSEQGTIEKAEMTPQRFVDIADLTARADGQQAARYQKWKAWSDRLRTDSRLIAYYAFDQDGGWKRKLQSSLKPNNRAVSRELDGAIIGARRLPGRWQTKSALEFKRPGDRVRVQIPGEFNSLTFACWVKIDSLDRWYNSLFLTDNYNQGEPHWQILNTGQLFFSVRHRPDNDVNGVDLHGPAHQKVLSPPFWKPSLSGRWLHLATTYDADVGRTTHYLNGKLLHQEKIRDELLVKTTRIGAASIGNWSIPTRPDAEFAIRNLNGSMDEFTIFAGSLSAEEIWEMYDNGKP